MYVSDAEAGPWALALETAELEDSRMQEDPLPLQLFALNQETSAHYVKFEVLDWWGMGGGLQFLGIQITKEIRNENTTQAENIMINENVFNNINTINNENATFKENVTNNENTNITNNENSSINEKITNTENEIYSENITNDENAIISRYITTNENMSNTEIIHLEKI